MFAILLHKDMDAFYQNITAFPTVIFTILLLLCVFYWCIAVLGLIEIDSLDLELESGVDGAGPDALAGMALKFGFAGIPIALIVTLLSLFGWLFSYYCVHFFFGLIPSGILTYLAGIPVLLAAAYLSLHLSSLVLKPLKPLFKKVNQQSSKSVLGQTAIVRTSTVNHEYGEAILEDGGASLILKVRAETDTFKHGDKVILLQYLSEQNAYLVTSEKEFNL